MDAPSNHCQKKTLISLLQEKLNTLQNIDESSYQDIINIIDSSSEQPGYTQKGQLKIAVFDVKKYDLAAFAKQANTKIVLQTHENALSEQTAVLAKGAKVVCVFVNDVCNAKVIEQLASFGVELIALRCAGFNNVDLNACKQFGIDVVRVPAYSPHAVAEHSVALMLMLNRNLHRAYLRNRNGQFVLDGLVGFNMFNKTIGIMGTGKIGECVVNILSGFGCKILAYDTYQNERLAKFENVKYVSFDKLLEESEIITLHAPLLPETYHCINTEAINKMKKGTMLINTSRGGLVDAKALITGLKNGQISSAGLDVYEEEANIFFKDMSNSVQVDDVFARLLSFSNVVITSHQAFLTHEALANIAETTIDNINEYIAGKRGENLTNVVL